MRTETRWLKFITKWTHREHKHTSSCFHYFDTSRQHLEFIQRHPYTSSTLSKISFTPYFFKHFSRTWVLFEGPLIPLFWTSGDVCPGFQSQGGFLACNGCLTFPSGATPADIFHAIFVKQDDPDNKFWNIRIVVARLLLIKNSYNIPSICWQCCNSLLSLLLIEFSYIS